MPSVLQDLRTLIEATGSWLNFETACGRSALFNESYMAYPIGQSLMALFAGEIRAEVEHPLLAPVMTGPGDKPRIDFAVIDQESKRMILAVETKWLRAHSGIEEILRDLVRLELALAEGTELGFFVLGGVKRKLDRLFRTRSFRRHPDSGNSRDLMPTEHNNPRVLRLFPSPAYRKALFRRAFGVFKGIQLPQAMLLQRCVPFPQEVRSSHFMVYGWRVSATANRNTFLYDQYEET